MVWPVPVYGLEEADTEKRWHDLLAQDVGKQHSAFPLFWRKLIIEEDVLCHVAISEPGTNKPFLFCTREPPWRNFWITHSISWKLHLWHYHFLPSADLHNHIIGSLALTPLKVRNVISFTPESHKIFFYSSKVWEFVFALSHEDSYHYFSWWSPVQSQLQ